jgi:hypothetical protein
MINHDNSEPIDTLNRFGVGVNGEKTIIPTIGAFTSTEALQLAAWLVAVNYGRKDEFDDLLKRVLNT